MPPKRKAGPSSAAADPSKRPAAQSNRARVERGSEEGDSDRSSAEEGSLVDGASSDSSGQEASYEGDDDGDDARNAATRRNTKKLPSEGVRLKRWRRVGAEEREAVTSEGGAVWRCARPILAALPRQARVDATRQLSRAMLNSDIALEQILVPPSLPMPQGSASSGGGGASLGTMHGWRAEVEGVEEDEEEYEELDRPLGEGGLLGDIATLEALLLPEAVETVALEKALKEQASQLETTLRRIDRLKESAEIMANDSREKETLKIASVDAEPALTPAQDAALGAAMSREVAKRSAQASRSTR